MTKIRSFIQEARIKGYSDEQIRQLFKEKDWQDEDMNKYLREI